MIRDINDHLRYEDVHPSEPGQYRPYPNMPTYDELLLALSVREGDQPCELRHYDDRRGGSYHEANYRSRAAAQARADELNEGILNRFNDRRRRNHVDSYNAAIRLITEHNALFEAGLRPERQPEPLPSEPVLLTMEDLTEGELVMWAHDKEPRRRWPKEHYFVRTIEFES